MARSTINPRTGRRARLSAAVGIAVAAHLAMLGAMQFGGGRLDLPAPPRGPPPISVVLSPPPLSHMVATNSAPSRASRSTSPSQPVLTRPSPSLSALPTTAPPSAPGSSAQGPPAALTAALRGSLVGCANADAVGLSEKEREACRQRFAAGGRQAAYLSPIPAEKLAYYDAVAKARADWLSGRNPGHLPFIACRLGGGGSSALPHALKLGPCYLEPPVGSLDIDADVPPPGRAASLDSPAAGDVPFHLPSR